MDHLSRHAAWTHRLARSLVSDETLAADIAQDAWVSALRRPPDTSAPLRPWFRRVVRHQLFNRSREAQRRATRERLAGVPDGARSPEDMLGRTDFQRILVEAVTARREPYRQIVLLRYFDDLSSTEISRKLNVPAATVRGRLKTAIEEVRSRLDARCRGREEWLEAIGKLLDDVAGSGGGSSTSDGTDRSQHGSRSRVDSASTLGAEVSPRFVVTAAIVTVVTVVSGAGWIASTRARRQHEVAAAAGRAKDDSDQVGEGAPAPVANDGRAVQARLDGRASSPRAGIATRQLAGEFLAPPAGALGNTKPPVLNRATRLAGTVQLEGLVRGADPLLDSAVGPGGGLANVVVRIVKGLTARYPVPPERVRVRLSSAWFAPQIRVGWYGQPIELTNLDPSSHDVSAIIGSTVVFRPNGSMA
jgi:RNA polymerase sigma-70 factor (ECF subfamily)